MLQGVSATLQLLSNRSRSARHHVAHRRHAVRHVTLGRLEMTAPIPVASRRGRPSVRRSCSPVGRDPGWRLSSACSTICRIENPTSSLFTSPSVPSLTNWRGMPFVRRMMGLCRSSGWLPSL